MSNLIVEYSPEEQDDLQQPEQSNVLYLPSPERSIIDELESLLEEARKKNIEGLTVVAHHKDGSRTSVSHFTADGDPFRQIGYLAEATQDVLDSTRSTED